MREQIGGTGKYYVQRRKQVREKLRKLRIKSDGNQEKKGRQC